MPVDVSGIKIGGEMIIRENLYQYYTALDPNSHVNGSSTIQDISGRNEDASSQDITWRNYYWDFDVNSDDVSQIDFPNAGMTGNIIAQDWSWEVWFISSDLTGIGGFLMLGNKTSSFGWDRGNTTNTIRGGIANSSGTAFTVTSGTLSLNTWHHSVLTYNGTGDDKCRLYMNGSLTGESGASNGSFSETNVIRVGATRVLVGTQATERWVGGLAVFRIYDRTLDADEVRYNYSCERGAFGV
jgi:hypothetical protein